MKKNILVFLMLLTSVHLQAQEFDILFQQCYGGSRIDGTVAIQKKAGGGYYVLASTDSWDGDVGIQHGSQNDYWLFETDASGQIIWGKTYGGTRIDHPVGMLRTPDGGFLLFGYTYSFNGDVNCNHHPNGVTSDFWLVRTDSLGELLWSRCYGGTHQEWASQIIYDHKEDCYVMVGTTGSVDGDVSHNNGMYDIWVVKIDQSGGIIWEHAFGGASIDNGNTINLTSDGGYIVGAAISYNGGNPINGDIHCREGLPSQGGTAWLLKLDSNGEKKWQQCYGGDIGEGIMDVMQTPDGGYIFLGITSSGSGDPNCFYGVPGTNSTWDMWVVKVSSEGQIEWQRCLGGTDYDIPKFIRLLDDGTYLAGGMSYSQDYDIACNQSYIGSSAAVIHRLSSEGELLWTKCYGSLLDNDLWCIDIISPDHYVLGATARLNGQDVNCNHKGFVDVWILEIMDTTVSIQEQYQANIKSGFLLYPNPATTETWLQLPEGTNNSTLPMQLISAKGILVYSTTVRGRFHKIETANLPKGLYLVRLWNGERWMVEKLVVR
jgi:hypothetical protein